MLEKFPPADTLDAIIPITRFNKGEANRIFDEVSKSGYKIVVKNNAPACILLDPAQYKLLMERLEDAELLLEAERRMKVANENDFIDRDEIMSNLGISENDLADAPDAEIE